MTSIIKLHTISGAGDESPPCYILQIDEAKLLLDCGWDENFDENYMRELKKHVKHIDGVLLTFPDPEHLGALPYLVGKCGLSCPIYATIPVYKMGQMFMYDLFQSRYNNEEFSLFDLDDVDAAFDKITQLKYNQTYIMKGKCHSLTIVPVPAGHIIGGTVWKIIKVGEEEIIYAVDFNHKKERHLNGCALDKILRPSLLITDAYNACYQQDRRRIRDEKLMTTILQTLSNNGNVLIAVDTAGRVLELAHMLDQLWGNKNSGLQNHYLCFLNNVSYNVVEFAKSQIEWMSDKLMKSFESLRNNPFQFKHIKSCHSVTDVHKISSSKVVLASMPDLECGYARDLCLEWISGAANSIILTTKCRQGTLARELIDLPSDKKTIHITIKKRERLSGDELKSYRKANQQLNSDGDSSDSDDVMLLDNIKKTHDFVVKAEKQKGKKHKYSISRAYPIFPAEEMKIKYDDYGELIDISGYIKERKGQIQVVEKVDEEVVDLVECPTKCVSYEAEVEVNAAIQFIEFEGKSDGESVQKLISHMRPRRIVLVKAPSKETEILAKYFRQTGGTKVFTPNKGEVIDATTEAHIYQIRLTDGLVSSLDMKPGETARMELAWVDAIIGVQHKSCDTASNKESEEDKMEVDLSKDVVPEESELLILEPVQDPSEIIPHNSIFVNELKLSELKQVLTKNGIDTEFSGGVLFCADRTVMIRRENKWRLSIEGGLSENYYRVRSFLYNRFAIL